MSCACMRVSSFICFVAYAAYFAVGLFRFLPRLRELRRQRLHFRLSPIIIKPASKYNKWRLARSPMSPFCLVCRFLNIWPCLLSLLHCWNIQISAGNRGLPTCPIFSSTPQFCKCFLSSSQAFTSVIKSPKLLTYKLNRYHNPIQYLKCQPHWVL